MASDDRFSMTTEKYLGKQKTNHIVQSLSLTHTHIACIMNKNIDLLFSKASSSCLYGGCSCPIVGTQGGKLQNQPH